MTARRPHGSGSLTQRTGATDTQWVAQWRIAGHKIKRTLGPVRSVQAPDGLTRRQAETRMRELMVEFKPSRAAGERLTVPEAGARYLTHLETAGRKPVSVSVVRGHLVHWHNPFFGSKPLTAIRPEDIDDLLALMRLGHRPGGLNRTTPLSPKTIRNNIGTLNALYRYAIRRGWATENPVLAIDLPAIPRTAETRFLTAEEVHQLAAHTQPGPYEQLDRVLFLCGAMTGLRVGELIALRWKDIDPAAGRLRVRRNYDRRNPDGYGTPKSRRSSRSVPMADEVIAQLATLTVGEPPHPEALVFPDPHTGQPMSKTQILKRFRSALTAAGLDTTHVVHDLRHTFGTRMAAAGVPMRTLQDAVVGPLIAVASFVCSVGNVPVAAVLWSGGISFGGVLAFLFADLIVLPIIAVYRKYYGWKFTLRIVALMFVTMVVAALLVDLAFSSLGLVPTGPRPTRADVFGHVQLDYKLVLDVLGLLIFATLTWLAARPGTPTPATPPHPAETAAAS